MAAISPTEIAKTVRGILSLAQKMIREKAHGRIIITIRDGGIQLIEEQRTLKPEDLSES